MTLFLDAWVVPQTEPFPMNEANWIEGRVLLRRLVRAGCQAQTWTLLLDGFAAASQGCNYVGGQELSTAKGSLTRCARWLLAGLTAKRAKTTVATCRESN
jgi:hypothetical protein